MTDERDYYATHRAPGRTRGSSSATLWAGLALIALLLSFAVFFLFGSNAPDNGTAAPDLEVPPAETVEPTPGTEPSAPLQ